MESQHRSNHKAVWAVLVDPIMLGAHLEAFHNAKPRTETLQLCRRFGQGESRLLRLLRKTPQEIIDVMLYWIIHLSRSRYYSKWLDDLGCVEGHFDGVNYGRYLCLRSQYGDLAAFEYRRDVRYAGLLASRKRSHMLLEAERRVQGEPTASGGKRFIDLLRNSDAKAAETSSSSHGAESSQVHQWERSPGSVVKNLPVLLSNPRSAHGVVAPGNSVGRLWLCYLRYCSERTAWVQIHSWCCANSTESYSHSLALCCGRSDCRDNFTQGFYRVLHVLHHS